MRLMSINGFPGEHTQGIHLLINEKNSMEQIYDCIRPQYMRGFQCDGLRCGSRCCQGWSIPVDQASYHRYGEIEPEADRREILSQIRYDEEKKSFYMKMREDHRCPFLRSDCLCELQRRYGESALSEVCYTYPRVTYRLGHVFEQSLAVTCPVAAEAILLPEEPIRFERTQLRLTREKGFFDWSDKRIPFREVWQEIQQAGIQLLQDRRFSLERRMLHLLLFFERLDQLDGYAKDILALLDTASSGKLASEASVPGECLFRREKYVGEMTELFHRLYSMEMTEEKRASLQSAYQENSQWLLPLFRQTHSSLLENYMVNEFFLRLYPYAFQGSFLYNGKIFVVSCKAVEFALFLTAIARRNPLEAQELLPVIDRIAERLEHSKDGLSHVRANIPKENVEETALAFAGHMLDL